MLFRRRSRETWSKRLRVVVWPRRSFWRSARYFAARALRLTATPHAIAAGVAAGVFASFLPFPGFHFILAAIVAWIIAGNIVASAFGTAIGNPLTFPLIWGSTLEIGRAILHGRQPDSFSPIEIGQALRNLEFSSLWEPVLLPMTVGAIPIGLAFALAFYMATRWATARFRERRRLSLRARVANAPLRP
jgi:uncharacterized protein (DUF2062 family)